MGWFGPTWPERRRVVVSTTEGTDFRGMLWTRGRDYLHLKSAEMVKDRGGIRATPLSIDGDVILFREKVLVIQVLGD